MKKYVLLLLIALFSCVSYSQFVKKEESTNNETNIEFHSLLDAYIKVGKASVKFGADTESEWASGQIDSICNSLKAKDFTIYEYMTSISLIRSLIAYSISYVPGTLGMHRDADLGRMAWGIPYESKIEFTNIAKRDFNSLYEMSQYSIFSLYYFNIYFKLISLLREYDYFKHEDHASLMSYMYTNIDKLYQSKIDSIQAYRNSIIISQSAFYMTFERLIQRTSTEKQFYENKDSLWSFALWFDKHTMPIQKNIEREQFTLIPKITEKEIIEYIKDSSKREVLMLQMLEQSFMNDN